MLIPTFSPQGDGNFPLTVRTTKRGGSLIPTFSPQGDGNPSRATISGAGLWLIPTFSPQGDGNGKAADLVQRAASVDPYLFPARGRKHSYPPPFWENKEHPLIPTFSPQGDGNGSIVSYCMFSYFVDPYLFPARGRKQYLHSCLV